MNSRVFRFGLWCAILSICTAMCAEDAKPKADFNMASLRVVLKSEGGKAIQGAKVMPYAMRMKEQTGHGYWNRELLAAPKTMVSDESGLAVIQYPSQIRLGPKLLTTRLVTFQISHTDFVKKTVHYDLGIEPAEVTLKAGCEVQLSAVDNAGKPIDDFGVVMAGPYEPDEWARVESVGRRTRSISDGTWQTMLVKVQDEGPILFSSVLPLRVRPEQTVRIRNLRLSPGVRVRGKLSSNVPGPLRGYVVATSIPKPAEDSWNDKDPSLAWHDWTNLAEGGSFEFASLPRGGQLQLIGICDGFISSTTDSESKFFVTGQVFEVNQDQLDIELKMEPTGTLEIKLVTEEGKPFTEGNVSSWPNQKYLKGGSTLLGHRYRTETQVRNQLLPLDRQSPIIESDLKLPYQQTVGKDGTVKLTGLPIGRRQSIVLMHEQYAFTADGGVGDRGEISVELTSPQPVLKTVKVAAARKEKQ